MSDEVKKVEGGAVPDDRVKSLEEALATEKAKNEVLMEQILKAENGLAEKDVEGFADVIPNADREFWRGQFLENRENATSILNRMRGRVAPATKAEAAPVVAAVPPVAVPPVAVPKPLHNRETSKPAVAESIEKRLFVDNGTPSIQTRLERHEMVIHALLWVVSVAAGTAIAGIVSAGFMLPKLLAKTGGS